MGRMMRKTTTILAVAFAASACGGTAPQTTASEAAPPDHPSLDQDLAQELRNTSLEAALGNREHFAPLCDKNGYPLPGNVNSKESAGIAAKVSQFCDAIRPKAPQAKPAAPACDRDALDQELSHDTMLDEALARHEHFRCLCDDQGYPLVGNISSKGTTASAFCGALREKNLL